MIIDCHGHYTTAPLQLGDYRDAQHEALAADPDHVGTKGTVAIGDDEIRHSLEGSQLRLQREQGTDMTLFSPRPAGWATTWATSTPAGSGPSTATSSSAGSATVPVQLRAGVPAAPVAGRRSSRASRARRCVDEMGFVGANLNPDPSGGNWIGPPLSDRSWYPLYEALCELDAPAMVHVSAACNPNLHTTGSHYLNADTTAFMQLLTSDVLADLPDLRLVIPHGGGAVPYHWGRFRGSPRTWASPARRADAGNVWFDTCVYHQAGIDCLLAVVRRPTTSCSGPRWWRGAGHRPRDRPPLRRHPPLPRGRRARRRRQHQDLPGQRSARPARAWPHGATR